MVIEKYMLTIGVRSVGGRPDITFAENLLLNLVSIISSYKSLHQNLLQIFVGEEKQQNLMKHPKLQVALTVIKKMVMFNIVEIPSVIFSPKRWK